MLKHNLPPLPIRETLTPADEAAVAAAVRKAAGEGTAVYPLGGGTMLDRGAWPTKPGVGLSLAAMRRVLDYPADDMTITVEPGLTVAELGARLAEHRQRLPVDIPHAERATVGGAVAANPSGPRRFSCGTLRDYVLGFRAVDGSGQVFGGGGRVVKNAAGLNLPRLMVGSLGTLGVLTQITLMVRPMPESTAFIACDVPELELAEKLLAALVQSRTLPAAVELLAGPTLGKGTVPFSLRENRDSPLLQNAPAPGPLRAGSIARLLVGFEGSAVEVEWMLRQLADEWRPLGAHSLLTVTEAYAAALWKWLCDLPAELEVQVAPSAAVAAIGELLQLVPGCAIQSHAGNGVIRVRLPLPSGEGSDFATLLCDRVRPAMAARGGRVAVLSCPPGCDLSAANVWGSSNASLSVMRSIRERFDPGSILNPGRLVD